MQLPERTPSTAQPTLPEGSLTAKLQARRPGTEALPGDHGARFGDELEQAAAREAGLDVSQVSLQALFVLLTTANAAAAEQPIGTRSATDVATS